MILEPNFVNKEQALSLKDLGFNEPCISYYNKGKLLSFTQQCNEPIMGHYIKMSNRLCAPLYTQAFYWFAINHKIQVFADYTYYDGFHYGYKWVKSNGDYGLFWKDNDGEKPDGCDTLEEAQSLCLDELIKMVKLNKL